MTANEQTGTLSLRYNRTSVHIDGLGHRGSYGKNAGGDMGRGFVEYVPNSHCPALSRSISKMAVKATSKREVIYFETAEEALLAAQRHARIYGGKVCAKCTEAALAK